MRSSTSLVAANEPIRASSRKPLIMRLSSQLSLEGIKIYEENALDVIAGYSCFNDGSVREFQRQ